MNGRKDGHGRAQVTLWGSVGKARRGDQAPELEGLPLTPSRSSTSCLMIRDALEDGSAPARQGLPSRRWHGAESAGQGWPAGCTSGSGSVRLLL